jgi:ketopantoate hydroxymethyltransferase
VLLSLAIPTIGIGIGAGSGAQVLVWQVAGAAFPGPEITYT